MHMNHRVSIIIPVYNVERYLDLCLDSVTKQTYLNIEIILVNDGSTDRSGEICDEWSKKDNRIKVLHKQNEGLNMARKSGYDISTGEFILFLDSDDVLAQSCIQKSLSMCVENNAEVCIFQHIEFVDSDKIDFTYKTSSSSEVKILTAPQEILEYALFGVKNIKNVYHMTAWGKLFSRACVDKIDWSIANYRVYEDNFWTPQALIAASKIILDQSVLMFYRKNPLNISALSVRTVGNSINGRVVGYLELVSEIEKFYKDIIDRLSDHDIDELLENYIFDINFAKMDTLIRNSGLCQENNLNYCIPIWNELLKRYTDKDIKINELSTTRVERTHGKKRKSGILASIKKKRS